MAASLRTARWAAALLVAAAALALPAIAGAREPILSYIGADGKFRLYDKQTEQDLTPLPIPVPAGALNQTLFKYGMSQNGRYLAYVDAAKKVHLFDRKTGAEASLPGVDGNANITAPGDLTVSDAGLIGFDNNGNNPAVVYDSVAKAFITTGFTTNAANKQRQPRLSGDARFLATTCLSGANCVKDLTPASSDMFVQNLTTKLDTDFPFDANKDEEHPCVNGTGSLVAFNKPNAGNKQQVLLRDRGTNQFVAVPGLDPAKDQAFCMLDGPGQYVGWVYDNTRVRLFRRSDGHEVTLPSRPFDKRSALTQPYPPPDHTAPVIAALSVSPSTFRVGSAPTPVTARKRPPRGSSFRYSLSEKATVTILIERRTAGRKAGGKCRKATRRLRRKPRCKRYVTAGTLTRRNLPAGPARTAFSGRIGAKALRPARYRATLTAADAAGNRSRPATATFRIVR